MDHPPPSADTPPHASANTADALRWLGLGLMLFGAIARGLTPLNELPHWDLDPLMIAAPPLGIGPAGSMAFDAITLLGAGLALFGEALRRRRIESVPCLLAAIGAAAVLWHGWLRDGPSLGDQRVGASWIAAIAAGLAAGHLCRDDRFRRVVAASLIGFVMVLALKGAQQRFIEHPETLRSFTQNRAAILASHGWTEGSAMARGYERRLLQPEATGWYGLSNVFASIAAAGAVAATGLLASAIAAQRSRQSRDSVRRDDPTQSAPPIRALIVLAAAAIIAGLAVALSGAKGGYAALLAGLTATAALALLRRRATPRLGGLIGLAAIAGPLALIAVRGSIGERIGELSLLFRWFYAQAALKIGALSPLVGVGPDGFQAAYSLAKPPISPEDVRSPHSILLDWWATLGVLGLAWAALLLWWMWHATAPPPADDAAALDRGSSTADRTEFRAAALLAASATIAAAWLDRGMITPDGAAVRVLGLVLWCIAAWAVIRVSRWTRPAALRLALTGAAIALAAHAQIEVAASWPASAAIVLLLIGAAAARDDAPTQPRPASQLAWIPGLAILALTGWITARGVLPAMLWERDLAAAASEVRIVGSIEQNLDAAASLPPAARDAELRRLAADLSRQLRSNIPATPEGIRAAGARLFPAVIPPAVDHLMAASARYPTEWRTRREASRLALVLASVLKSNARPGDTDLLKQSDQWSTRAHDIASDAGPTGTNRRAGELAWLAAIQAAIADLRSDPAMLRSAAASLEASARLDPYNLDTALRLFRINRQLGDGEAASRWARRSLELDGLARLDRTVRGLSDADRADVMAAIQAQ